MSNLRNKTEVKGELEKVKLVLELLESLLKVPDEIQITSLPVGTHRMDIRKMIIHSSPERNFVVVEVNWHNDHEHPFNLLFPVKLLPVREDELKPGMVLSLFIDRLDEKTVIAEIDLSGSPNERRSVAY
jgi:hypothetical protein